MKILFTAQDPGGCDSLIPVIKRLSDCVSESNILCIMSGKSKDVLKKEEIDFIDSDELEINKVFSLIDDLKPDVVVSGTSFGLSIDKLIIDYAKSNGIKSISIVDYWSNYWHRFKDMDTNKEYIPDMICVIDNLMKKEIVKEGFDESLIRITGNPRFYSFSGDLRRDLISKNKIVFISQPFTELSDKNLNIGYNEKEVLADIIFVIKRVNLECSKSLELVIRTHPKENPDKYAELIRNEKELKLSIDSSSDIESLILKSRFIIGMSSVVLFHAVCSGVNAISYQPSVKKDFSILNKLGIRDTITSKNGLFKEILKLLHDKSTTKMDEKVIRKYTKNDSIQNVLDIIHEMTN